MISRHSRSRLDKVYEGCLDQTALRIQPAMRYTLRLLLTTLASLMLLGAPPAVAAEPWDAWRTKAVEAGITPKLTYATDLLGNPTGGQSQRFRYAGDLSVGLSFDLQTLAKLPGLKFHLSGTWRSGKDLSQDIGNTFPPAQTFGGDTVRLYQMAFEQLLLDDRVSILAGRIGLGDEFLTSPLSGAFVSTAFTGNPFSGPANLPGFSAHPVATWGGRLRVQPTENVYIMTGLYSSNPGIGRNSAHGVDFSLGRGAMTITELGYLHNKKPGATGLPGNYKIGGYYDSSRFTDLSDASGAEIRGNAGFYVHLDQMVYRETGSEALQGLTPFVALTVAPSEHRNVFPFFLIGGLTYQGLFPGRDTDTTAFGVAYGKFSNHLDPQTYELLLEWTHAFAVTPFLTVQPDVQYIIRPGGTNALPNALVVGAQIALTF